MTYYKEMLNLKLVYDKIIHLLLILIYNNVLKIFNLEKHWMKIICGIVKNVKIID